MYRKIYNNKNKHIIKIKNKQTNKQEKLSEVDEVEHTPNTSISFIL